MREEAIANLPQSLFSLDIQRSQYFIPGLSKLGFCCSGNLVILTITTPVIRFLVVLRLNKKIVNAQQLPISDRQSLIVENPTLQQFLYVI
ncbi:MAG: hypothetical protein RMX96_29610 [Nostoc sp. ChiSLP02]|nr:hypothetical protein [Nostoc sp. DedSLP05]MDZ8101038.1 hypothetical protein [Nostoc sp. DedSLP01]MDZ8188998.1 hypothetical protein [Nostoc sp. ChiSLP02]